MAQQNNPEIAQVPTFTFSLANINETSIPKLFNSPQKICKRQPGSITNLRKTTVSQLLEVFRPVPAEQQQQFGLKKQLVTNAISAIYQCKKNTKTPGQIKKRNLINEQSFLNQLQRPNTYLYHTPQKNFTRSMNSSTVTTKRASSQSKLNYNRNQNKYDEIQIQKLRKRAGCAS